MKRDLFADIGAGAITTRRGQLQEATPPKLPGTLLPAAKSDPKAALIGIVAILYYALARARSRELQSEFEARKANSNPSTSTIDS